MLDSLLIIIIDTSFGKQLPSSIFAKCFFFFLVSLFGICFKDVEILCLFTNFSVGEIDPYFFLL